MIFNDNTTNTIGFKEGVIYLDYIF